MAFGPHMEVQRAQGSPIILDAIAQEDWRQVPSIHSRGSEPIRQYVTQKFIEEASTLKTPGLAYHHELEDTEDSTQWGIYAKRRKLSRYALIGFTGIGGMENHPSLGRLGHSRMVIMNADFLGQGIGNAAAAARTYHGLHRNGDNLDRIHSRVDIRNTASYRVVYNQGYRCFAHTGAEEPDWERHLLELPHPKLPFEILPALRHPEDTWQEARLQTRNVLEHARRIISPLLD